MKKIFFLFLLLPNIIFASFPVEISEMDTIRKNGKIYIKVSSDENVVDKVITNESNQIKKQRKELKVKNKKRKRTNSLLGLFGSFFVVALILAGILAIILIRLIIKSLFAFGSYR